MKPSINKLLFPLCAALALAACSDKPQTPAEGETPASRPPAAQAPVQAEPAKPAPKKPAAKQPAPVKKAPVLTAQQLAEELKKWDKKLNFLSTSFEQTTAYDGVQVSRSNGTLRYDRARNLLRLDTLDPDGNPEQTAVTDKKNIVVFDESGRHVTTLSWADWQQGQPNQALFDFGNYTTLVDRHHAAVDSQTDKEAVLKLTPKEGEEYQLYLTLSRQDYFPQTITIVSELMVTRADLTDTRKNEPLGTDVFGGFDK